MIEPLDQLCLQGIVQLTRGKEIILNRIAWFQDCRLLKTWNRLQDGCLHIDREVQRLKDTRPKLTPEIKRLIEGAQVGAVAPTQTLAEILRRQDLTYEKIVSVFGGVDIDDPEIAEAIQLEVKYEGYIKRQLQQIQRSQKLEHRTIPDLFDYDAIPGFSAEVREKLKRVKPASVGQASRISGVTPAAISLLLVAIERYRRQPLSQE